MRLKAVDCLSKLAYLKVNCPGLCIDSRECAIDVVSAHSGGFDDYIAALTLVAWQNLLINGRQVSLLRILIRQLSNYLLTPQSVDN